jgi:hypothetical protein
MSRNGPSRPAASHAGPVVVQNWPRFSATNRCKQDTFTGTGKYPKNCVREGESWAGAPFVRRELVLAESGRTEQAHGGERSETALPDGDVLRPTAPAAASFVLGPSTSWASMDRALKIPMAWSLTNPAGTDPLSQRSNRSPWRGNRRGANARLLTVLTANSTEGPFP